MIDTNPETDRAREELFLKKLKEKSESLAVEKILEGDEAFDKLKEKFPNSMYFLDYLTQEEEPSKESITLVAKEIIQEEKMKTVGSLDIVRIGSGLNGLIAVESEEFDNLKEIAKNQSEMDLEQIVADIQYQIEDSI